MTVYRHITVERCVKCQQPWPGLGLVCNDCRQIEALENVAKSNNKPQPQSQSNYSISVPSISNFDLILPFLMIFGFFYIMYLLDWIPLKIMWWMLVMIVTIVSSFF